MAKHFLAFDLGAESGRALLGVLDVGKLVLEECHRFANPQGRMTGHLRWNLMSQWEHLKEGLRRTATINPGITLDGIGVDTWGVDFGLIGPGGAVLDNPVCYRDAGTEGLWEAVVREIGRDKLFQQTGTQIQRFNTLFQLVALSKSNPKLLDCAETLLFMPDLFNYLFTGMRKAEFSIASTSQMYDMTANKWATPLLNQLQLPTQILPDVVPSGTVIGMLTDAVAAECGLSPCPVIAPCGHDTGCAVAAVPAEPNTSWCYISSGTWSLMGVELDKPLINAKSLKYNYTNEGGVGGSTRFLRNIMGLWLVQECRRHWIRLGEEISYAELTEMARLAESTALIDPDDGPFLAPGDMVPKIDAFVRRTGQRPPATPGEYVRNCLESLALTYRRTLEGLEDMLGRRLDVIHIVGGGTQNTLLNQMTADACGRTVVAGPVEATAIGNILVQAMAVGAVKSLAEARGIVRDSFNVTTYEPRDSRIWNAKYEVFRTIVVS